MKLIEVFDILNIRNKLVDKKLPIKTSYKLNRLFNELEVESKFFNETLEKIIDEYGQKDEAGNFILTDNGQGVKIKEEKFSECKNKIDELSNVEIHLDYEPVFSLDELDGLDLEMKYINLLIPFISEN